MANLESVDYQISIFADKMPLGGHKEWVNNIKELISYGETVLSLLGQDIALILVTCCTLKDIEVTP